MKKMLEQVDYTITENKHKMNDLFAMSMSALRENDREFYNHIKCELYEIVYGKTINDDMAEHWVMSMKPMAKWTKEEVDSVRNSYDLQNIPLNYAYVLFNMAYSDDNKLLGDGNSEESLSKYIQAVKDFFYDEDYNGSGEEKTYDYGKYIAKVI